MWLFQNYNYGKIYTVGGLVHSQCVQPVVLRRLYVEAVDDLLYCIVQRVCKRQTFLCATAEKFRYNWIWHHFCSRSIPHIRPPHTIEHIRITESITTDCTTFFLHRPLSIGKGLRSQNVLQSVVIDSATYFTQDQFTRQAGYTTCMCMQA